MQYDYKADDGEIISVFHTMRQTPKAQVRRGGKVYRRVWSNPMVVVPSRGGVEHKGQTLPVSYSMPPTTEKGESCTVNGHQVQRLRNGTYATPEGKRIVDSRRAADLHAKDCGMVRD